MREIKFRAKGIKENKDKWFVGSLFVENGMGIPYIVSGVNTHYETNYLKVEVDPDTVGQFTGLTDANGDEIYEGDVLAYADYWGTTLKGKVYFRDGSFYVTESGMEYGHLLNVLVKCYYPAFVIGNVHDNPGLLEQRP